MKVTLISIWTQEETWELQSILRFPQVPNAEVKLFYLIFIAVPHSMLFALLCLRLQNVEKNRTGQFNFVYILLRSSCIAQIAYPIF